MTFMFVFIVLGATHPKAPKGFAGIAIGLGLTLVHLVSISVTNTSVNPAREYKPGNFCWRLGFK
jgi:aquaporin Z